METEKFIEMVRKRSPIWDRDDIRHNVIKYTDQLWDEISAEVGKPKKSIKIKWKNIRDQYRNHLTKYAEAVAKNSSVKYDPPWPFFKHLHFLKNHMRQRSDLVLPTSPATSDTATDAVLSEDSFSQEISIKDEDVSFDGSESASTCYGKKRKLNDTDDDVSEAVDPDECFLLSLLPHFRNVDLKKKLLCQIEVQKVIMGYAYGGHFDDG